MLYMIDQRNAEPEMCLALYRAAMAWAAPLGGRFVIRIQRGVYEDSSELERLLALGRITQISSEVPPGLVGRLTAKIFRTGSDVTQIEGTPSRRFTNELTRAAAPAKAVSGDLSPVEDVLVFQGNRALFAAYDYGRDLILDLNDEEVENLRRTLVEEGLEAERVIRAPESIASDSS
jgi:hypothetical protein